MAVQTTVVRLIMAGVVAITLSGCVTVPDAIKGSSPTPQQDLVRVMNAPELYVGQEARFGGKVVEIVDKDLEIPVFKVFSAACATSITSPSVGTPAGTCPNQSALPLLERN